MVTNAGGNALKETRGMSEISRIHKKLRNAIFRASGLNQKLLDKGISTGVLTRHVKNARAAVKKIDIGDKK